MYAFSLDNQDAIISSIKDHESIKATFFVDVSLILIYFMTFMYTCTQHRLFELNHIYIYLCMYHNNTDLIFYQAQILKN